MKKIILALVVLIIIFGGYRTYQLRKDESQPLDIVADDSNGILTLDLTIEKYLLSQKDFSWKTEENSKSACVFERLEGKDKLFPIALWVYCQEYKILDREIKELSGSSGPILLDYPNRTSFLDIKLFTHQKPRDGSLYALDIKKMFSKETQNIISSYSIEGMLSDRLNNKIELSIAEPVNSIQLPTNIISEKDCIAQGGEIWNTLGETSYDGKLIGKVEGLNCPCVCLVK